jgi:hypothetical protein
MVFGIRFANLLTDPFFFVESHSRFGFESHPRDLPSGSIKTQKISNLRGNLENRGHKQIEQVLLKKRKLGDMLMSIWHENTKGVNGEVN